MSAGHCPAAAALQKYLESILAALSRAELVEGTVGRSGGYRLTRPPEEYPVGEILRAVEGDLSPIACQSEEGAGCGSSCDCDARLFWQGLEDQINSYIDNHTLAQFMRGNETTPANAARKEDTGAKVVHVPCFISGAGAFPRRKRKISWPVPPSSGWPALYRTRPLRRPS